MAEVPYFLERLGTSGSVLKFQCLKLCALDARLSGMIYHISTVTQFERLRISISGLDTTLNLQLHILGLHTRRVSAQAHLSVIHNP